MLKRLGFMMALVLLLAGCARSFDDDEDIKKYRGLSAKTLYYNAHENIKKKDYDEAIKQLEALDSMHPFSQFARQAESDLIYAYYQNDDYAEAAASAEHYIHLYPRDKNVDYAYYMKAMANFAQKRGTFAKFFNLDESWRAPGSQLQSYDDFLDLTKRFPRSRYYNDSIQHLVYLRNQFAQRELNIASLYFDRKRYVAALNRAKHVIAFYQQAPQAKKALTLIAKINKKLGLMDATEDASHVYDKTYRKA